MATVEKMPMLAEGYQKLSEDLKRLKAERPLVVDAIGVRARAVHDRTATIPALQFLFHVLCMIFSPF